MAFTLDATQTTNGEFHGQGKFNYSMSETRRRITAFSVPALGRVVFTLVASSVNANPFAVTNSTQTDKVKITGMSPFNGTWSVLGVGTNTITVSIPQVTTGTTASVTLNAMATRVTAVGADKVENRKLSSFKFNWGLKSNSTMCATQNQVFTILSDFYKDPEIKREYSAKWKLYQSAWDNCGYGPSGDYSPTSNTFANTFLKSWMCVVSAESTWRASAIYGPEYLTKSQTTSNYSNWYSDHKPSGLWQIGNLSGTNWWPNNYTTVDHNDVALPFNREYNTRIALWIMFNRLFNSSLSNEFTKPFRSWSSPVSSNSRYTTCQSTMPPYPQTSPYCQDYV